MSDMKFSKQREAIKEFLNGNTTHPTADDVYFSVRKSIPNISLGTVYRNLNQMADAGEIRRLCIGQSQDRFDYNTDDHAHFICRCCGTLRDISDVRVEAAVPGTVESRDVVLYGICSTCIEK